jgi:hypothetical protein
MKLTIYPMLLATSLSFAGIVLADDAPSAPPVKSLKQKMHECMAQQRADNSGLSKEDMKKACAAKLQSEENHPSRPQPSSPDSTHN